MGRRRRARQFSSKHDPVLARCGDVIASRGDQLITIDLPAHRDRRDGKAFNDVVASAEIGVFEQLARSQSSKGGLLACSIGAYVSLCDTPAGTFERAWLVSPLLDLERCIRDVMAEYSVTDEQLEEQELVDTPRAVLQWSYLRFVRERPARLDTPAWIIRGDQDEVVPLDAFSQSPVHPGPSSSRSMAARTSSASTRIWTRWWRGSRNATGLTATVW